MDERGLRWWLLSACALLFCGGILLIWKACYDYTVIKNVVGFAFCCIASGALWASGRRFAAPTPVLITVCAFLVWILASFFWAQYPYGAGAGLEPFLLYILIFLVALHLRVERAWVYLWLGAVFIATVWAFHDQFFDQRRYIISSFGNPNFYAGHVLMPVILAAALLARPRQRKQVPGMERAETVFCAIVAATGACAIVLTQSRAALVGLLFGLALLPLIHPAGPRIPAAARWVPLTLVATSLAVLWQKVYAQFHDNIRYYIWRGTWRLITDTSHDVTRLFKGVGIGNFIFQYPYYRVREYFLQPESTPVTNHPHCEYLELWAEVGLIGLLLFLAVVAACIISARSVRDCPQSPEMVQQKKKAGAPAVDGFPPVVRAGLICGVCAVLVDNILSTNLRNASTAMYLWFSLGVLAGQSAWSVPHRTDLSRVLWGVVCVVSAVMGIFTFHLRVQSEVYLKQAIWAREARQYEAAVYYYSRLVTLDPHHYVGWYKMAFVFGESGKLDEALRVYTHLNRKIFPHFAKTDANLGNLFLRKADHLAQDPALRNESAVREAVSRALFHLKWAEYLNPYDEDVLNTIASIHIIYRRDIPTARKYLERVLTFRPDNEYANRVLNQLGAQQEAQRRSR